MNRYEILLEKTPPQKEELKWAAWDGLNRIATPYLDDLKKNTERNSDKLFKSFLGYVDSREYGRVFKQEYLGEFVTEQGKDFCRKPPIRPIPVPKPLFFPGRV